MKKMLNGIILGGALFFGFTAMTYAEEYTLDDENNEIEILSSVNDDFLDNTNDFDPTIKTRDASGYTYKGHVILSSKTYTNKELKRLKTSRVWSTASNSVKPVISVSLDKSYSVSTTLNNGIGSFGFSQSISVNAGESYSTSPKSKGYKTSIGLYAKKSSC